jgi:hypothetical protein
MTSHQPERPVSPPLNFDNKQLLQVDVARNNGTRRQPSAPPVDRQQAKVRRRTLRLLVVAILLGLATAAAARDAAGPLTQPQPPRLLGFDLRAEALTPKFNSTSAKTEQMPATPLVVEAPVLPPLVEAKPVQFVEQVPSRPVALYGPGLLDCFCYRDVNRGDTPMLSNWNVVKWSSLLAAVLAVNNVPAVAQDGTQELKDLKKSVEDVGKKLDELKSVESLRADIKTLSTNQAEAALAQESLKARTKELEMQVGAIIKGLEKLEAFVGGLQKELEKAGGRDVRLYPPDKAGIDERLSKIEAALDRLDQARTARAAPITDAGRILLVNSYPEEMLFVINGVPHRVQPYTTKVLDNQQPGRFSYEVISGTYGPRGTNQPLLEPGKTYTITVR